MSEATWFSENGKSFTGKINYKLIPDSELIHKDYYHYNKNRMFACIAVNNQFKEMRDKAREAKEQCRERIKSLDSHKRRIRRIPESSCDEDSSSACEGKERSECNHELVKNIVLIERLNDCIAHNYAEIEAIKRWLKTHPRPEAPKQE